MMGHKELKTWQWVTLWGVVGAAFAVSELLRLSQKWEDAIVYTVTVFAVVIVVLRPAWSRPAFWQNLLAVFALHLFAITLLIQIVPIGRFGIPKLLLIGAGMLECLAIGGILWKRTVQSKPGRRPV